MEVLVEIMMSNVSIMIAYQYQRFDGGLISFWATVNVPTGVMPELWCPHVSGRIAVHAVDVAHNHMDRSQTIGPVLVASLRPPTPDIVPFPKRSDPDEQSF
jgi:hypothetical protein